MLLDQIELSMLSVDDKSNQDDVYRQINNEIGSIETLSPFLERWQAASKIRIWLQEMRKDISNDLVQQRERVTSNEEEKRLFTEEELQEDIVNQQQKEIDSLVQKVIKKAELLINLSPPTSWNYSSKTKKQEKVTLQSLVFSTIESKKMSLKKLKTLITMQSLKAPAASFENLSNEDVFSSCSISVLVILQ